MVHSALVDNSHPAARPPRERQAGPSRLERARGEARIGFVSVDGRSRLADLYQSGAAKIRLPRGERGATPEAVFLNTAGGVTGGDRLAFSVSVGDEARAVATTQAAERIYRRSASVGEITTRLSVGPGARLDWLPQETIIFDCSALLRTLDAEIAPDATFIGVEAVVLGRTAMGETIRECSVRDSWRIRRGGQLVFADSLRIDGNAAGIMAGPATGRGAAAFATLVLLAPDAESRIDLARAALDGRSGDAGVSAWNGMLVARLAARNGQGLRADLVRLIEALRATAMPRVWNC
ncbi:MAG: urease accessory protein UreD [Bauldia sp.]